MQPVTAAIFFKGLLTKKTAVKSLAFGFWLIIFALIAYVGYLGYKKIMQKTETYETGSYKLEPKQTFGCMRFNINGIKEKK